MRKFIFNKEDNGRWYVCLPEWLGDKEDLEMVGGADTMLDIMSEGNNYVLLYMSLEPVENFDTLELDALCCDYDFFAQGGPATGAFYKMKTYMGVEFNLTMWLCDVTKFVFGDFPQTIYIKKQTD